MWADLLCVAILAEVLAMAGGAGAQVALRLEGVVAGAADAAVVPGPPAVGMKAVQRRGILRKSLKLRGLGLVADAGAGVAAGAEGLLPVARAAVGGGAARVDAVQRHVIAAVEVQGLDHAVVAIDAVLARVAALAILLVV